MTRPELKAPKTRPGAAPPQGVFGSIAISFRSLPALERMEPTYRQIEDASVLHCSPGQCGDDLQSLIDAVDRLDGAGFVEKLHGINILTNRYVTYKRDIDNYGVLDYWATPRETLKRGSGDCEDYAILKLALLDRLGVPATSMSVVIIADTDRKLYHAVLTVRTSQGNYVLDNLRDEVLKDSDLPHYQPLYSLSAGRGFIHGRRSGEERMLVSGSGFATVAPGEGPSL